MARDGEYGAPNASAPAELSRFAFLIGPWRCDVRLKKEDGTWQRYQATWEGRYILDGYVIADEYRMTDDRGEVVVHGMNFRSYSVAEKAWTMKWLNARGSFWLELGPESLGGVHVAGNTIVFDYVETFDAATRTRVTFSNISETHFTWSSETSRDQGETWAPLMVIEAHRS